MAPMSYVSSAAHSQGGKDKDVNLHLLRNGALLKRLDLLIHMNRSGWSIMKPMQEEIRSLEFWRSVIAECLASFFYVFFICGCYALDVINPSTFQVALATGSAIATLVLCFGPISGANVNPAVSVAFAITRKITVLRMFLYVTAQCGGAIAGTALLYGMTVNGPSVNLGLPTVNLQQFSAVQGFGIESLLTFIVVMTIFATLDPYQSPVFSYPSPLIGLAYLTCSLTGMASTGAALNPARALGPAFVLNKWSNHWIYWGGPLSGAILAGLIYEYVFDSRRHLKGLQDILEDLNQDSSLQSNDDECEQPDTNIPQYSGQPNVYHSRYDDYSRQRGQNVPLPYNGGASHSNYAQYPPPPPPPLANDYRAIQNAAYSDSTTGNNDSLYESASAFRPHSSASRNYSSIYGTRGLKPPHRLDGGSVGPGSTKF